YIFPFNRFLFLFCWSNSCLLNLAEALPNSLPSTTTGISKLYSTSTSSGSGSSSSPRCKLISFSSLLRGKTASCSFPSPIHAKVGPVVVPPSASLGISGRSNPNFLPPKRGTQSGTSQLSLLIPRIKKFIPSITRLIIPLNTPVTVSTTPVTIPSTDFQAPAKSPENISTKNTLILLIMSTAPLIIEVIVFQTVSVTLRMVGQTVLKIPRTTSIAAPITLPMIFIAVLMIVIMLSPCLSQKTRIFSNAELINSEMAFIIEEIMSQTVVKTVVTNFMIRSPCLLQNSLMSSKTVCTISHIIVSAFEMAL